MKADFSRQTFLKVNHYSSVRMQQGRVQMDADWNEQLDISAHRTHTETQDVIGLCGGPLANAGFHLVTDVTDLSADDQAREENQNAAALLGATDFYISGGRYYVDGRLTENEQIIPYSSQPHLPNPPMVPGGGIYLAYLDVWEHHVTALEDEFIREKALGGPDTATRSQTLWQVRWLRAGNFGDPIHCLSASVAYDDTTAAPNGRLAARAEPGASSSDPCIVPASAGYRRLENQLYRIEVHDSGPRGTATFKWSRENGSVVARWESQNADQITVSSAGRDKQLGFSAGDWVELIDEERELNGLPGTLVRLVTINDNVLTLDLGTATDTTDIADFDTHKKVRRWDSAGTLRPTNSQWRDLEDGVQMRVTTGDYRTGDYWTVPARTIIGDVQWPRDEITDEPVLSSPEGIEHHYCRLGVMHHDGASWTLIEDCRHLFPPLTEFTSLFYVSGDGQEALPDATLDKALQVGVANGEHPVAGARVRFRRLDAEGSLLPGSDVQESGSALERIVITGADGLAECLWQLGSATSVRTQCVEVTLLDVADNPRHLPIIFNASLSLASHVYYDGDACAPLANADTVQDALDTLAGLALIAQFSGDGQQAPAGSPLPQPLEVVVSNVCGPIAGARVRFTPQPNGRVGATAADLAAAGVNSLDVTTDANGIAQVMWRLANDQTQPCQFLTAELVDAGVSTIKQPAVVQFTGCLASGLQGCLVFLDELRANGVVRDPPDSPLGLEVTANANGDAMLYSAGIAYVAGCRFEIEAGSLALDTGTLSNTVVVDNNGVVMLLSKDNQPDDWAHLASVDFNPTSDVITRVVDRRTDLTHLDDRVRLAEEDTARRTIDRREGIPLLANTLPNLQYKNRRNVVVPLDVAGIGDKNDPLGMAYDGQDIWVSGFFGGRIYHLPADPRGQPIARFIDVGFRTSQVCYDGNGQLWFTVPKDNLVMSMSVRDHSIMTIPVGQLPTKLATDGRLVWVANRNSTTVSTIDISRGRVLATTGIFDPNTGASGRPTAMVYDGEYLWVGTDKSNLFRKRRSIGANFEQVNVDLMDVDINSLGFDGAQIWIGQADGISVIDAVSLQLTAKVLASRTGWPGDSRNNAPDMLCDGRRMWFHGLRKSDVTVAGLHILTAAECVFADVRGSIEPLGTGALVSMAYDGSHIWSGHSTSDGPMIVRNLVV